MFKVRLLILFILILLGQFALMWRLGELQLARSEEYRTESRLLLEHEILFPTSRGGITDRNGLYIAVDKEAYALYLDYRLLSYNKAWMESQIGLIARNEVSASVEGREARLARAKELFIRREQATWDLADKLAAEQGVDLPSTIAGIIGRVEGIRNATGQEMVREELQYHPVVTGLKSTIMLEGMVGARIVPVTEREYPYGAAGSHIIGTLGRVNATEMGRYNLSAENADEIDRVLHNYRGEDVIGKTGVEKLAESILKGQRGYQRVRRRGTGYETLTRIAAERGEDVHLSIDIHLQEDIEALFRARAPGYNGAAVVIDIPTGEILALVSIPTYDLNTYAQDYPQLATDEADLPLLARAVKRKYPPGSTVKPISAIAGLAEGVMTPTTEYYCAGYLHEPTAFRCWIYKNAHTGHGSLSAEDALKNSCNVYFYNVGEQMGIQRQQWWMGQFGFGKQPGTGLPEERAGGVGQGSSPNERGAARMLAIGQGPFDATPLQCANALATVARGGRYLSPVLMLDGSIEQQEWQVDAPASSFDLAREGMYRVCNETGGTAYKVFHGGMSGDVFRPLSFAVSGKTGTAQSSPHRRDSNEDGRITGTDQIVYEGDMAWFGGFGPSDNPQIAVAVVVEYVTSGGGSSNAAPIGREIFRLCKERGYVR